jgi:hypothetical protein
MSISLICSDSVQMGMVAEPGGQAHQLVTATAAGELKFIDFRMGSDSKGKMGVYKTLQAHSKGNITAIVGHPYAPLIATGTTTQVEFPQPACWAASLGVEKGGRGQLQDCGNASGMRC